MYPATMLGKRFPNTFKYSCPNNYGQHKNIYQNQLNSCYLILVLHREYAYMKASVV